jgi:4a-hydroxytetrahydrobiopterin dehydratase
MPRPDRLTDDELAQALAALPRWSHEAGWLVRSYRFRGFADALAFMVRSGLDAERLDHHPNWSNVWATVDVRLQTHDAGGLTALDVRLAEAMEAHAAALGAA